MREGRSSAQQSYGFLAAFAFSQRLEQGFQPEALPVDEVTALSRTELASNQFQHPAER
jgi:hypothetical protein